MILWPELLSNLIILSNNRTRFMSLVSSPPPFLQWLPFLQLSLFPFICLIFWASVVSIFTLSGLLISKNPKEKLPPKIHPSYEQDMQATIEIKSPLRLLR